MLVTGWLAISLVHPIVPKEKIMKTLRLTLGAAIAVASMGIGSAANAAPSGIKLGELTCNVASGWGFVFGSSKDLHCTFRGNNRRADHYVGSISKFGVDIGYTEGGVLVWGVFAPTSDMRKGSLSGDYVGGSAQVTAGLGVGANALIGGFDKSFALQPVSVEGSKGLNVAAGVGSISLHEA